MGLRRYGQNATLRWKRRLYKPIPSLPPFDGAGVCPQCGIAGAAMVYVTEDTFDCQRAYAPHPKGKNNRCTHYKSSHFHRHCRRCGFIWAQAPNNPGAVI